MTQVTQQRQETKDKDMIHAVKKEKKRRRRSRKRDDTWGRLSVRQRRESAWLRDEEKKKKKELWMERCRKRLCAESGVRERYQKILKTFGLFFLFFFKLVPLLHISGTDGAQ